MLQQASEDWYGLARPVEEDHFPDRRKDIYYRKTELRFMLAVGWRVNSWVDSKA